MCYEYLEVYEKLLENQKAQTANLGLIIEQKDIQVDVLKRRVAYLDKDGFFHKLWKAIRYLIAAGVGYLIGSSL